MRTVQQILDQLEPLMPLMEALHARTCLREVWDALHTVQAATLDDNTMAWLELVTVLGSQVNVIISEEIDKLVQARGSFEMSKDDVPPPISFDERKKNTRR
jgi:hypothetical protein